MSRATRGGLCFGARRTRFRLGACALHSSGALGERGVARRDDFARARELLRERSDLVGEHCALRCARAELLGSRLSFSGGVCGVALALRLLGRDRALRFLQRRGLCR